MTGDSSRAEPEHNRRTFLSEQRQQVNLKVPIMFRTFVKVRHASVFADSYQLCYDSYTNTNPIQSIRYWSGGCCFISLCSAICGVSVINRKSAMSRPLTFCSSVALSSKILLTRTCLHIDCSNGSLLFHLSAAPRSGTKTTSRPFRTSTASLLKHPFMPPVANHTKSDMKWVGKTYFAPKTFISE